MDFCFVFFFFKDVDECQCKAQIRPRPAIFVWDFFSTTLSLRIIRNKKNVTLRSPRIYFEKSKLTNRKCDLVSVQYLFMSSVELMNGPMQEVYKPTILIYLCM